MGLNGIKAFWKRGEDLSDYSDLSDLSDCSDFLGYCFFFIL